MTHHHIAVLGRVAALAAALFCYDRIVTEETGHFIVA